MENDATPVMFQLRFLIEKQLPTNDRRTDAVIRKSLSVLEQDELVYHLQLALEKNDTRLPVVLNDSTPSTVLLPRSGSALELDVRCYG